MSTDMADLVLAADHLIKAIDPPTEQALSIGTFFKPGRPLALRVSIRPQFSYLMHRVPDHIDGFEVLRELAAAPTAY